MRSLWFWLGVAAAAIVAPLIPTLFRWGRQDRQRATVRPYRRGVFNE